MGKVIDGDSLSLLLDFKIFSSRELAYSSLSLLVSGTENAFTNAN